MTSFSNSRGPHRPKSAGRRESGFSIVELMVAMTVLAVSLMGLAQLLGVAIQQNSFASYNTVAVELARGKLEHLKASYDSEVASGQASPELTAGNHGPEVMILGASGQQRGYALTWQVTHLAGQQRRVTIQVKPQGISSPETQTATTAKTVNMTGQFAP